MSDVPRKAGTIAVLAKRMAEERLPGALARKPGFVRVPDPEVASVLALGRDMHQGI